MAVTHGHGNPNWTRDETILALNLLFKLDGQNPSPTDKRIIKLSEILNSLPIHPLSIRKEQFRNPAGVAFKIQNLRSVATGKGLTNVSAMDKAVWNDYGNKPDEVAKLAKEIIEDGALFYESDQLDIEVADDDSFVEGKIITATHKKKERSKDLRKSIILYREKNNSIRCDICGLEPYFDSLIDKYAIYECHHIVPLSQAGGLVETKKEDIAFLCSNCHKAIHKRIAECKKWVSPNEMKALITKK